MLIDLTPQFLIGIVGIALSLAFSYFPALNTAYAGLKTEIKSLIMIGLLALTSGAIYALTLAGVVQTQEPLTVVLLVKIFIAALIANQVTYSIAPPAPKVVEAKDNRDIAQLIQGIDGLELSPCDELDSEDY
jgi:hypothetical protein